MSQPPDQQRGQAHAYPHLRIAETTVRGRPAFLLDGGEPTVEGWTTAMFVIERRDFVSQVLGSGFSPAEVLSVARGLTPASPDALQQWAARAIEWHFTVEAWVPEPELFVADVRSVSGVTAVTSLPSERFGSDPALIIQHGDPQASDPTIPVNSGTSPPTFGGPGPVHLLVVVADPSRVENVTGGVAELSPAHIVYSPEVGQQLTAAFFAAVLGGAELVHDDPAVHQPAMGPEPRFDTAALGTEVPLLPATRGGPWAEIAHLVDAGFGPGLAGNDPSRLGGPLLHIGALEDGTRLVLSFDGGADYIERTFFDGGWAAAGGSLAEHRFGEAGAVRGSAGIMYITVRVPLETAIVLVATDDGSRLWQRPVAGHALFLINAQEDERHSGDIPALGPDGEVVGVWQLDS